MDQNAEVKNQKFFRKHQNTLMILGGILILLIIFFATKKKPSDSETASDQNQQQVSDSSNTNNSDAPTPPGQISGSATTEQDPGNVSVVGTLMASDNSAKGNLMLDSQKGKIYVQTSRDQSALMGKEVTLQAQGDLKSFTFMGFTQGQVAGSSTDTTAAGGGDTLPASTISSGISSNGNLTTSGKLAKSDNAAKGNYVIKTASGTVYLQTQKDYSSLVDQDVNLAASGTIQSFTSAVITKK